MEVFIFFRNRWSRFCSRKRSNENWWLLAEMEPTGNTGWKFQTVMHWKKEVHQNPHPMVGGRTENNGKTNKFVLFLNNYFSLASLKAHQLKFYFTDSVLAVKFGISCLWIWLPNSLSSIFAKLGSSAISQHFFKLMLWPFLFSGMDSTSSPWLNYRERRRNRKFEWGRPVSRNQLLSVGVNFSRWLRCWSKIKPTTWRQLTGSSNSSTNSCSSNHLGSIPEECQLLLQPSPCIRPKLVAQEAAN